MLIKTKRRSCVVMLVIVSMLFTSLAQGKKEMLSINKCEGRGGFMFGGNIINIKDLNSKLENKGYSKLSDNFVSFGGGGYRVTFGRVIMGGEGHGLVGKKATRGNYETSLSAGYGFFNVGYLAYSTGALNVYPLLGLGGGGISFKILEKIEKGSPSFDEVLDNPKRGAYLNTGGFLVNLALGADYLLKLGEEKQGGLVFGLRLGYILAPIKGDWELNGIDISKGPNVGITGPYLRLVIGGGCRVTEVE